MINPNQLLKYVIYPVLDELGFDKTDAAKRNAAALLLYTCKQESNCGEYIHQLGNGPALGIMQMEPNTFYDICDNYLCYRPNHIDKIVRACGIDGYIGDNVDDLIYNLKFSVAMARIQYLRTPPAIPAYDNFDGMWKIYKKYYNSVLGAATEEEFRHNFDAVVKYL